MWVDLGFSSWRVPASNPPEPATNPLQTRSATRSDRGRGAADLAGAKIDGDCVDTKPRRRAGYLGSRVVYGEWPLAGTPVRCRPTGHLSVNLDRIARTKL